MITPQLTLLEYYAGLAMQSLIRKDNLTLDVESHALKAVSLAKALIRQLEKEDSLNVSKSLKP